MREVVLLAAACVCLAGPVAANDDTLANPEALIECADGASSIYFPPGAIAAQYLPEDERTEDDLLRDCRRMSANLMVLRAPPLHLGPIDGAIATYRFTVTHYLGAPYAFTLNEFEGNRWRLTYTGFSDGRLREQPGSLVVEDREVDPATLMQFLPWLFGERNLPVLEPYLGLYIVADGGDVIFEAYQQGEYIFSYGPSTPDGLEKWFDGFLGLARAQEIDDFRRCDEGGFRSCFLE